MRLRRSEGNEGRQAALSGGGHLTDASWAYAPPAKMLLERDVPPPPPVPGREESSPPAKMDDECDLAAMALLQGMGWASEFELNSKQMLGKTEQTQRLASDSRHQTTQCNGRRPQPAR